MWSLMFPGSVDWSMKTAGVSYQYRSGRLPRSCVGGRVPSSSRTDSPIDMLDSLLLY